MKSNFYKITSFLSIPILLFSCAGEDINEVNADVIGSPIVIANITYSELYGTWNLNQLVSDTLVNLNDDDIWNTNLRMETTCFDRMSITFNEDKTYSSINARIDFKGGETDDKFVCMDYSASPTIGTWEIEGNVLTLKLLVDGVIREHTKELTFQTDRFSFKVNRIESQQYFTDPGNTAGSRVNVVSSEYIRAI